ncbi:hypothetical protein D515_00140 [Grimontia indica]|uniref:Response regulatory domain-containing protein n=1 Tax=Grimontia indica TaxID=1056512 RepID=R1GX22_9GAMM|nr:hypothetical protein [Grimontia indica]EOD80723.1 hypothetical protein D515_00140 [Grimontia indica]
MKLKLLIVEDVQQIIEGWKEKLDFYAVEDEPKYIISPHFVTNLQEAEQAIKYTRFDAAVIDIRLDENGQQTHNGNEILSRLSNNSLTVCAVHTGEPGTEVVEEHLKEFVRVFSKGEGEIERILDWLDAKADMISAIQTMQDSFNTSMAKAFTKSVWPRWSFWLSGSRDIAFAKAALTRHMATHLHASFLNEVSAVHPEEYYFLPPLQDRLDTGDIIQYDGAFHILVTPRCDLAREQNATFQLVKLLSKKDDWVNLHREKVDGANRKAKEVATKSIGNLVNHGNRSPKLHFIPQFKLSSGEELGPFHAQFNIMQCIEATPEMRATLTAERIATLSNEFVPSLVERLGAYFSRIGTPDYSHPE